jgi:GWxTD domain-containing protein
MLLAFVLGFLISVNAGDLCPPYEVGVEESGTLQDFEILFAACPDFIMPNGEAVAYRYARLLEDDDRTPDAIQVLDHALAEMDSTDAASADLFALLVYRSEDLDRYDVAAEHYLRVVRRLDDRARVPAEVAQNILDEVVPLLSAEMKTELGIDEEAISAPIGDLPAESGRIIEAFWRQADFLPATSRNERLVEHLSRVAQVRDRLVANDGRIDARGVAYLRYGEPHRRVSITAETGTVFSSARRYRQSQRVGVLPEYDVAKNELWVYSHVHRSAHFLFIYDTRRKAFRHGAASELLPRTWAGSQRRTPDFLHLMEHLYRQLALHHSDYGVLYSDVANYNMSLRSGQPQAVPMPAPAYASTAFSESLTLDYHIQQTQRQVLPDEHSNVREEVELLPVETRIARFLTEDGSTRTELYWGTSVEALFPDRRSRRDLRRYGIEERGGDLRYLLSATALKQDQEYRPVDRRVRRYNLGPYGEDRGLLTPGPMMMLDMDEPYRLSVQWDLLAYEDDGTIGPLVKFNTESIGVVEPLNGASGQFEVSDLKPVVLAVEGIPLEIEESAYAYPFRRVGQDANLALVFEVYNLTEDASGERHYSVEYSVIREREGFLRRLLPGGRESDQTSARAEFIADEQNDNSFILVDLANWNAGGEVEIRLTFTDEVTGASVVRSIGFDVSSRLSSDRTAHQVD